jgi:hypothetical protein
MNTINLSKAWDAMQVESTKILRQMIDIENAHPEAEAPEFITEPDREEWELLHRLHEAILNRQTIIERAINEFCAFYELELS